MSKNAKHILIIAGVVVVGYYLYKHMSKPAIVAAPVAAPAPTPTPAG
jgi:hypothetical protein